MVVMFACRSDDDEYSSSGFVFRWSVYGEATHLFLHSNDDGALSFQVGEQLSFIINIIFQSTSTRQQYLSTSYG